MVVVRYLALLMALALLALSGIYALEDDEKLETFTVDEPLGRTFITVNGSNIITTPNFVVGITLIGISLALLLGSAASASMALTASTLAGGTPPGPLNLGLGPVKYKRSLPDEDQDQASTFNAAAIFKTFASLEQQFKNFDVTDVECRKRIICEIHQESNNSKRLGNLPNFILDTFNNLSPDMDHDKYPYLTQYLEAANQGKAQKECSQVYNTCEYSVKNVLRNLSF